MIRLNSPSDGSTIVKGSTFSVLGAQQMHPEDPGEAITLQFSNHPSGPWTTCRPPGGGGALECAAYPWSAQEVSLLLSPGAVAHEAVYARLAVFEDQGCSGEPLHVSENVCHWLVREEAPAE